MSADRRWTWRDAGGAAALAKVLLYASAGLSVISAGLAWSRGFAPQEEGLAETLVLTFDFLVYIVAVIVILRWIYLAQGNARALGASDMLVSPGWAVGWFFVPLMNLVMPFIAMRELWKASANPKDWQAEAMPLALPFWWGCWIASGVTGVIGFQLAGEFDKEAAAAGELFFFASQLFAIPSALLLARIVAGVQAMQARFSVGSPDELRDRFA